jgi:hypothetical protein
VPASAARVQAKGDPTCSPGDARSPGLRRSDAVGYAAGPATTKGSKNAIAAKSKKKAKKPAAKKAAKRAAAPKSKRKAAAAKGRSGAKAGGSKAAGEVVYSDVLHELRSSLVSRLIR